MENTNNLPGHNAPGGPRRPYIAPVVTRVPLVPEELLVASCAKTPNICRGVGAHMKIKS